MEARSRARGLSRPWTGSDHRSPRMSRRPPRSAAGHGGEDGVPRGEGKKWRWEEGGRESGTSRHSTAPLLLQGQPGRHPRIPTLESQQSLSQARDDMNDHDSNARGCRGLRVPTASSALGVQCRWFLLCWGLAVSLISRHGYARSAPDSVLSLVNTLTHWIESSLQLQGTGAIIYR